MNANSPSQDNFSDQSSLGDSADTADHVRERVAEATHAAQEQVSAAAQPVVDKARELAEQQKGTGAERIQSVARAVHTAADDIGKQSPQVAEYIHSGAEQLEKASRLLRDNSVDDLLQMTNPLAHDRPLAFIGGSVAAGFVLARFLKSSGSASAGASKESRP